MKGNIMPKASSAVEPDETEVEAEEVEPNDWDDLDVDDKVKKLIKASHEPTYLREYFPTWISEVTGGYFDAEDETFNLGVRAAMAFLPTYQTSEELAELKETHKADVEEQAAERKARAEERAKEKAEKDELAAKRAEQAGEAGEEGEAPAPRRRGRPAKATPAAAAKPGPTKKAPVKRGKAVSGSAAF